MYRPGAGFTFNQRMSVLRKLAQTRKMISDINLLQTIHQKTDERDKIRLSVFKMHLLKPSNQPNIKELVKYLDD
jgi:hypothetical protein